MDSIRVATWNVSLTGCGSRHFDQSQRRIAEIDADILVLTETTPDLVPAEGFVAKGGPDWGYSDSPGRRKVLLGHVGRSPMSLTRSPSRVAAT